MYLLQGGKLCAGRFEGLAKPDGGRSLSFKVLAIADAGAFADALDVHVVHGPLLVGLSKVLFLSVHGNILWTGREAKERSSRDA